MKLVNISNAKLKGSTLAKIDTSRCAKAALSVFVVERRLSTLY